MGNIKEEKLRKIKRSNIAGSVIGLLILGIIIFAAFAFMLMTFATYITDSKVRAEYERASDLAAEYASTGETKGDYIVTDAAGNVIKEHGENTCDLAGGGRIEDIIIISEAAANAQIQHDVGGIDDIRDIHDLHSDIAEQVRDTAVTIYPDKKYHIIRADAGGRVWIDYGGFRDSFNEIVMQAKQEGDDEVSYVRLPFWTQVPMEDGTNMIFRSSFDMNFRELSILGILSVIISVMTVALFVYIVIFLCKNLRNRKRMQEVFFMDEITGKHNWMWFLTNSESLLRRKSNAANKYAVLDIEFINYRNFCVCHSVKEGEEMLRLVGDKIEQHLEKKNELCARHSAAHFAALMTYTDRDVLEERIRKMVAELERVNSDHKFNFQIGIDRIPASVDSAGKIIRRTDVDIEREYNNAGAARATIAGDDSTIVFFDEKMVEEQKWIDMVSESQEKALENEEFLVYYQPKYDPRTNELKGAEALIRWNSLANGGLIPPGRFIPLFEKNGFITKIDHYMLEHVSRDQKKWLDEGRKCVPVSVNVSRAHFIEDDLAEQIRDIVDAAGTPHDLIEIELTESAFFDDKNALITTIGRLKEYGFTVSMDDFGSGYSSLNSLKEMPLDVLKLDADFFRNDDGKGRGRIVVAEAISLAKKLSMKTVAEGVEEKNQVDFLADEGCDMIQGYYFAKPMPKEEFESRM